MLDAGEEVAVVGELQCSVQDCGKAEADSDAAAARL